jgi:IS5 family transposase
MHQQTFAEATSEQYRKSTRRERFFDEMNCVVPWTELVAVIAGLSQGERIGTSAGGRQTHAPLHCLQQWFNLSDPAVEEALYDSRAMRCQGSPKCP